MASTWLWYSSSSLMSFSTSSPMILAKDNFVDYRHHRYCSKSHSTTLSSQSSFQAEMRNLLVTTSHVFFYHLEAGNDVEVIFPKLFESKTGPFMVSLVTSLI
ncbi:hypothetical protein AVEN_125067-1 [Araneus ventricosus]|uniref:Uncharacterized protein n=1 Tax=Araneus ventricosus TaxID=182803 RepID=A0A4Y2GT47_ARAVE|nr:hypothetical protein AVEN_125067-1 [Araneus ventricosus]